ncbi:CHAD domain-containing protein [Streptomyces sp. NBC_01381]|uniref:CHAD domain-containing protein n=1 Tax=Streptomyces sp. NBC_01381 TaxID=2903845 RepID=UPI002256CD5C|nr:CHAD domain-containing protein [Streptomyces sp. NBC_01381]MCX4666061.1 CHAD domain-containing protein [Streptomyces sp. NBC_01381]
MAQQHLDESTAGEVLAAHLRAQATEFLRSLRLHRESTTDAQGAEESLEAARALRRAARRIGGTLHTFRPLLDQEWVTDLRPELAWLSGTLAREHAYATRLERLLDALHRLSGAPGVPAPSDAVDAQAVGRRSGRRGGSPLLERSRELGGGWAQPSPQGADDQGGAPRGLTVGAAKAAALLERQLTLARTRAHSAALQAFGSSRFHAVADNVAVLASEVPLSTSREALEPLAAKAESNLAEAVAALPLGQAGHPYNAEALVHGLATEAANEAQDAPWLKARALLRLHRYAQEVLRASGDDLRLADAGHALDRHREAADAASAAASAARTPRIAPATAYALGVLHADQRHEVEAARFDFHQAWLREAVRTP